MRRNWTATKKKLDLRAAGGWNWTIPKEPPREKWKIELVVRDGKTYWVIR